MVEDIVSMHYFQSQVTGTYSKHVCMCMDTYIFEDSTHMCVSHTIENSKHACVCVYDYSYI